MQRAATAIRFVFAIATAFAVTSHQSKADSVDVAAVTAEHAAESYSTIGSGGSHASESVELRRASMEEICATLHAAADAHELPVPFFARLIWQESRFRAEAVSRAGARGIAQFMPATARERGLSNPHDPIEALRESAEFLRDLRDQFGNLGLAAAAYNGGPGRVQAWLKGRKGLPTETRDYVRIVTGVPADQWRGRENADAIQTGRIPARVPCPVLLVAAGQVDEVAAVSGPARAASAAVLRAAKPGKSRRWEMARHHPRGKARVHSARGHQRSHTVVKVRNGKVVISRRAAIRGRRA